MKVEFSILLILVVLGGVGMFIVFNSSDSVSDSMEGSSSDSYQEKPYIEIVDPSGFVNTDNLPVTLSEYIGNRVILLDIMTYSCINCQRTFPYVTGWYEKYKDDGFIVIGLHTPEFAFEKDIENVREAMERFGINYPVVLDNDYATWRAYGNRYWPRKYLIDIHGNIVYDHIGEGAYEETEAKIQELLLERQRVLGLTDELDTDLVSGTIPKFTHDAKSPETYFGSARNEYLANKTDSNMGISEYTLPDIKEQNHLYLGGQWRLSAESAEALERAIVIYPYLGKEVFLVAGSDSLVQIEVWQDGELIGPAVAGDDVTDGMVEIQKNRLYKLIENESAGEHTLELRIKGTGVKLYAFTFG